MTNKSLYDMFVNSEISKITRRTPKWDNLENFIDELFIDNPDIEEVYLIYECGKFICYILLNNEKVINRSFDFCNYFTNNRIIKNCLGITFRRVCNNRDDFVTYYDIKITKNNDSLLWEFKNDD